MGGTQWEAMGDPQGEPNARPPQWETPPMGGNGRPPEGPPMGDSQWETPNGNPMGGAQWEATGTPQEDPLWETPNVPPNGTEWGTPSGTPNGSH